MHLLELQLEYDIVRQISMTKTAYYAFLYSDRQLNDIEKFCCCNSISDPLAIDTTFNLCDLWLTVTSFRNRRLVVDTTRSHQYPLDHARSILRKTKKLSDDLLWRYVLEIPN